MFRLLLVSSMVMVAGCAANSPETQSAQSYEPMPAADNSVAQAQTRASSQPVAAAVDDVAATSTASTAAQNGTSSIDAVDIPQVSQAPVPVPVTQSTPESPIVCEKFTPTGSVIPKTICRTQAEIDRKEDEDRREFDDIKRNTAIGASRL